MKLCLRCNQYFEDNVEKCPTDQSPLERVGKDPLIGALINNRYLVDSVIGKGSSGIVYRATRLGRGEMVVAIKVLHSYVGAVGSALDRFLREAQAASQLRNPHIITIWESGVTEDGQPYFVMDYLEGLTLGRLIREKGQIEPQRVLSILRQACEALAEAHRQGIVHRDLKPENIVLQESDHGHDYVKLLDFGIAESPQHSQLSYKLEKPRTVSGSPAYMSPEQCQGFELDTRSDIYSLAIVVYEMLTGKRPFRQTENVNVMVLHVNEKPMTLAEARPDLAFPPEVENVIAHALAKQPDERQANIQDFFVELEKAWEAFAPAEMSGQSTISATSSSRLPQATKADPATYTASNVWGTLTGMRAQEGHSASSNLSIGKIIEDDKAALNSNGVTAVSANNVRSVGSLSNTDGTSSVSNVGGANNSIGVGNNNSAGDIANVDGTGNPANILPLLTEEQAQHIANVIQNLPKTAPQNASNSSHDTSEMEIARRGAQKGSPKNTYTRLGNRHIVTSEEERINSQQNSPESSEQNISGQIISGQIISGKTSTVDRLLAAAKKGQISQKNSTVADSVRQKRDGLLPANGFRSKTTTFPPPSPQTRPGPSDTGSHSALQEPLSASLPEPLMQYISQNIPPETIQNINNTKTDADNSQQSVSPSNSFTSLDSRLMLDTPLNAPLSESDSQEAHQVYLKQKTKTTLTRIDGWQKVPRPPAALVSTRARAAALKAETVRRPINLWYVFLTIVVSLSLGICFYVIYSALSVKIPPAVSVAPLLQAGEYERVKAILEGKQLSMSLSSDEKQALSLAYLNLAKSNLANNQPDQAFILLTKVDPQSKSAAEAEMMKEDLLKAAKAEPPQK